MKHSPCWNNGDDCPRRHLGCREKCEEWAKWLAEHEAKKEKIRQNRSREDDVNGFLALQNKRASQARQRESKKRSR